MDNNSTFVPGMEKSPAGAAGIPNPYAPSSPNGSSTYVPGMQLGQPEPVKQESHVGGTPIVGFLYTISRGGATEYWPIHVGANVIGRGSEADISLNEATVSTRHAQLNVKQLRKSHKLVASIQDIGSKTGMLLNDEELGYEAHPCQNGDIVTIGDAYKLLVILVDVDAVGLGAADNFIATEVKEEVSDEPVIPTFNAYNGNPYDRNDGGTVDLSGAAPIASPGGTMILE